MSDSPAEQKEEVVEDVTLVSGDSSNASQSEVKLKVDTEKSSDSFIGKTIGGHYEIISKLGTGGMSVVYKARHSLLHRIVAIKFILPQREIDSDSIARFQQEAKAATALSHPNVAKVSEFGMDGESPYLVMDYIEGETLSDCIDKNKKLEPVRAAKLIAQACAGFAHAHAKGIVHRDVKPGNLMITNDESEPELVKIVDFGIAKAPAGVDGVTSNLTKTGDVFGSPLYMSPEQCKGKKLDARSDVYSLGCVLYELVAGQPPFRGENVLETLHCHINDAPPKLNSIPPHLQAIIMRCLEKDPAHRFASMDELQKALARFIHESTGGKLGEFLGHVSAWRTRRRRRMGFRDFVIVTFFATVTLIGLLIMFVMSIIFAPSPRFDNVRQTTWIWQRQSNLPAALPDQNSKKIQQAVAYFGNEHLQVPAADSAKAIEHAEVLSQLVEASYRDWDCPVDAPEMDFDKYFPATQEMLDQEIDDYSHSFRTSFSIINESLRRPFSNLDPYMQRREVLRSLWSQVFGRINTGIKATDKTAPLANARLRLLRADSLYHLNCFDAAASEYEAALSKHRKEIPAKLLLKSLEREAESNYFSMHFNESKRNYEDLLTSQETSSASEPAMLSPESQMLLNSRLGDCLRMLNDYENAAMRYRFAHKPKLGKFDAVAIKSNQAMSSLYLCYLDSISMRRHVQDEWLTQVDKSREELDNEFGKNRYQGIVLQDLSNVYWNYGDVIQALGVRYTAFCIRLGDQNIEWWDGLPLYKRIRPTTFNNVVKELTGIELPEPEDNFVKNLMEIDMQKIRDSSRNQLNEGIQ